MAVDNDGLQPVTEQDLLMKPVVSIPFIEDSEEIDPTDSINTTFDSRYREPFVGLLYLGHLTETVTLYGHTFVLTTPTQRERLEAGLIHKKYVNSISGELGWAALVVAMYLDSVDGIPLPEPIGPSSEAKVTVRFSWVIDNIKNDVITDIFNECLLLDAKVNATLQALEESAKI